jgi:ParB family transcriptional regulator, chromosome partitioning protein
MNNEVNPKRRALGRGLSALIANTEQNPSDESAGTAPALSAPLLDNGIRSLPITRISPNPQQPRTHFEPAALAELADSIRTHGIIQPVLVTEAPGLPQDYWLVAGERRWRAAQLAGLSEIPAIIRSASSQQLVEWALVENIQRSDLNALEEAAAYQTLVDEFQLTQAEIGQRVGKSRSAVANTLRLLQLPRPAQEALLAHQISPGHARALLALEDRKLLDIALSRVLERGLSVRQTEELVKQLIAQPAPAQPADAPADPHMSYLENRFRAALGTRVALNRNSDGTGRLVVHFYNDDDLNNLFQIIAGDDESL